MADGLVSSLNSNPNLEHDKKNNKKFTMGNLMRQHSYYLIVTVFGEFLERSEENSD